MTLQAMLAQEVGSALHAVAMQGQLPAVLRAALLLLLPMRDAAVPHSAHEPLSAVLQPVLLALPARAICLSSLLPLFM